MDGLGKRMKNRREHRVPLSQQALATLEELDKVAGHSQWLMPGRLEDKPASRNVMPEEKADEAIAKLIGL